jgi:hypothetical protein
VRLRSAREERGDVEVKRDSVADVRAGRGEVLIS